MAPGNTFPPSQPPSPGRAVASRQNVEQKFRCDDLHTAHARAVADGANPRAVLLQRDVYFHAPLGRLKLRSILSDGRRAHELIAYSRADGEVERLSCYYIVPVDDAVSLEAALAAALGIRTVVSKRRTVLLDRNVRIHLDEVDGLGDFVEFEAVLDEGITETRGREQVARWRERLGLLQNVPVSYVDLAETAPGAER